MSDFINTIDVLGDDAVIDSIIDRSITDFKDNVITKIGNCAFNGCAALETVDLPNVTSLGFKCFCGCNALEMIDLPNVTSLGSNAFDGCTALSKVNIPKVTNLPAWLFLNCKSLSHIDISNVTHLNTNTFREAGLVESIMPKVVSLNGSTYEGCTNLKYVDIYLSPSFYGNVFNGCKSLITVVIRGDTVCSLSTTMAFNNTPIKSGTGYIYVPRSLVDSYKAATNWSTYAAQVRALEDYTVDGTVTGKFDETKI